MEPIGPDRSDLGRVKAAVGVMSSMTKLGDYNPNTLFPIPPPDRELSEEEQLLNLELFGGAIDRQCQPNPSEH